MRGLFFNFWYNKEDASLESSNMCDRIAGICPESIARAIWVPIDPQPNNPIRFKQRN